MEDVCGICREPINEYTRIDECSHAFCFRCIVQWANQSNSCPLCQRRFLSLSRGESCVTVAPVDRRERNALEVMEQLDSGEQSICSEEASTSGDDYLEEDFVVPDHIVIADDGAILDMRELMEYQNPFGKVKKGQKNCTFQNALGEHITIEWLPSQIESDNDDDDEAEYVPKEEDELDDEEESVTASTSSIE